MLKSLAFLALVATAIGAKPPSDWPERQFASKFHDYVGGKSQTLDLFAPNARICFNNQCGGRLR